MAGEKLMIFPLMVFFLSLIPTFLISSNQYVSFNLLGIYTVNISFSDFFILLTAASLVVIAAGITVLGSGLNNVSVLVIFRMISMGTIWVFLSGLSIIGAVPYLGFFLYWFLSLIFFAGLATSISNG